VDGYPEMEIPGIEPGAGSVGNVIKFYCKFQKDNIGKIPGTGSSRSKKRDSAPGPAAPAAVTSRPKKGTVHRGQPLRQR
jgi:hypothetical protein